MKINIHTVFILKENILFIDEWIAYHIAIGVDKIFLYDNSKSSGWNRSAPTINRYNYNYAELTSHLSDEKINTLFNDLIQKYEKYITYILWSQEMKMAM